MIISAEKKNKVHIVLISYPGSYLEELIFSRHFDKIPSK